MFCLWGCYISCAANPLVVVVTQAAKTQVHLFEFCKQFLMQERVVLSTKIVLSSDDKSRAFNNPTKISMFSISIREGFLALPPFYNNP